MDSAGYSYRCCCRQYFRLFCPWYRTGFRIPGKAPPASFCPPLCRTSFGLRIQHSVWQKQKGYQSGDWVGAKRRKVAGGNGSSDYFQHCAFPSLRRFRRSRRCRFTGRGLPGFQYRQNFTSFWKRAKKNYDVRNECSFFRTLRYPHSCSYLCHRALHRRQYLLYRFTPLYRFRLNSPFFCGKSHSCWGTESCPFSNGGNGLVLRPIYSSAGYCRRFGKYSICLLRP